MKKRAQHPVITRIATTLLVAAAVLFIVPPIIAGVALRDSGGDVPSDSYNSYYPDPEGLEGVFAGLIVFVCWLVAFVLLVVGGVLGVIAALTTESDSVEERRLWTRQELGLDVDGKWMCFEHDVVECPMCSARVRYPAPEPQEPDVRYPVWDTANESAEADQEHPAGSMARSLRSAVGDAIGGGSFGPC